MPLEVSQCHGEKSFICYTLRNGSAQDFSRRISIHYLLLLQMNIPALSMTICVLFHLKSVCPNSH